MRRRADGVAWPSILSSCFATKSGREPGGSGGEKGGRESVRGPLRSSYFFFEDFDSALAVLPSTSVAVIR